MKTTVSLIGAAVALTAIGCSGKEQASGEADIVFANAKAYTLDVRQTWADSVAVKGDAIVYVGDMAGAEALIGDDTTVIDLGGDLLLPGFIDSHAHPLEGSGSAGALELDTYAEPKDWIAAIEEYAKAHPDKEIIFGLGYLASAFGPDGPTREMIDAVVPDRPVLIMDEGFHTAWVNTAALEAMNVTRDTPDPLPGYSYYKRDEIGDATGYLLEGVAWTAPARLGAYSVESLADGLEQVVEVMNSYGITSAFDGGLVLVPDSPADVLSKVEGAGKLNVRIIGSWRAPAGGEPSVAVENAAKWRDTIKGERYHFNTLKIPNDGTVEARTAAMFEDYQGEPGNSGHTVFTEEQLAEMMTGAAAIDMDVHVHALGERAIHETLNAIEAMRSAQPDTDARFTICHIQVIRDQDLLRFAELDVIAQSTPLWASYDDYGERFVSEDQFQRFWRFKSLENSGARLAFGSDFPATGAGTPGLAPLLQIEIGATRQYAGEPDAPVQPRESERLSIESLVRGYTIDAAYQLHLEDEIGSIEVGKKADLVVLDQNIFEVDPYRIHETNVVLTMMDGDIVYEAR